jgi:hypothetical protein
MNVLTRSALFAFFRWSISVGVGAWSLVRSKAPEFFGQLLSQSLIPAAIGFFAYWAVFSWVRHANRAVPYSVLVLLAVPGMWALIVFIVYPDMAEIVLWQNWQWDVISGFCAACLVEGVELISRRLPAAAR